MRTRHEERRRKFDERHSREVKTLPADQKNIVVYINASTKHIGSAIAFHIIGGETKAILFSSHSPKQAEAQAVRAAVMCISEIGEPRTTIYVFTNSQATIRSCKKYHTASPTVGRIFDAAIELHRPHGARVNVRYIPGHTGIRGNETGHLAAEELSHYLPPHDEGDLDRVIAVLSNPISLDEDGNEEHDLEASLQHIKRTRAKLFLP